MELSWREGNHGVEVVLARSRSGQIDSGDLHPPQLFSVPPALKLPQLLRTLLQLRNYSIQQHFTWSCNVRCFSMSVSYDAENAISDATWVALLLVSLH